MTLHTTISRTLTLAALCSMGTLGCDSAPEPGDDAHEARGGLLFDLTEEEIVEIHATYLASEDLDLTRERLTAPFDCALYDDFCDEVGAEAAEAITAETIDLAREGAPIEEIEALLDARIHEAVRALDPEALPETLEQAELVFRGSSSTAYHTQGDFRLGVRNGITTPAVGDRRAWTQASASRFDIPLFPWLPPQWLPVNATQICINAGTNTQTYHFNGQELGLESINPANACVVGDSTHEISTWHDRLSGSGSAWYDITVRGSATASINGLGFTKTAPMYTESF